MARIPKTDRDEILNATRRRLLDAAIDEFANKGFTAANINHISEAAGYSKGTIYNYFPSKQALMLALIADAGAKHVEYIKSSITQVAEPEQRLEQFYAAGFHFVEEHPSLARFLITTLYSPEIELKMAMGQAYQPMFRMVAQEIVALGVDRGIFQDVDPASTAMMLMTLYLGTASNTDPNGKPYMDSCQVANFALHALRRFEGNGMVGGNE
jgi:AcrR family transcriptional regulator